MMKKLDANAADIVARAMTDRSDRKILICTAGEPKSIEQISFETRIPLASCYRRVEALIRNDLLKIDGIEHGAAGKKFETYKRNFCCLSVSIDGEGLSVWADLTLDQ